MCRHVELTVQMPPRQQALRILGQGRPTPKVQITRGTHGSAPGTPHLPLGVPEYAHSLPRSAGAGLTSAYAELSTGQQSRSARPGAIRAAPIATA